MPYEKKTREWLDWDGKIIRSESHWEYRPLTPEEKKEKEKQYRAAARERERQRFIAYLDGVIYYQAGSIVLHKCECGVYTQMGSRCSKCTHTISRDWGDPTIELDTDVRRMNYLEALFLSGKMETDRFFELHDKPSNWKRFDKDTGS